MKSYVLAGLALGLASTVATAGEVAAGDWLVRVGYHTVNPKSDNASVFAADDLNVGQDTALTFNVSYFFTDNIAVELQAATPFNHDISVDPVGKVAATKHLPPTLNVQYHFDLGAWKPYVGAGLNWTIFFDENTVGALSGTDLDLDDSFGWTPRWASTTPSATAGSSTPRRAGSTSTPTPRSTARTSRPSRSTRSSTPSPWAASSKAAATGVGL